MFRKQLLLRSILIPVSLGVFVYFNVGSNVIWAIAPLMVNLQLTTNQSEKITQLEKDIVELKSRFEDVP